MEPTAMGTFLTTIGEVFTQSMTWVGNLATTVVSTPILLVPFGLVLVKKIVGIFKRLILRK